MTWPGDRVRVAVKRRGSTGDPETLAFWDPEASHLPRTLLIAFATARGAQAGALGAQMFGREAWVETRKLSVASVGAP